MKNQFLIKLKESLVSVLPITLIVILLNLTPLVSFSTKEIVVFSISSLLLILGIGMFTLGADLAMTPMGDYVGSGVTKTKKFGLLIIICFILGLLITIAEPDLTVLANQVKDIMSSGKLIFFVGLGVAIFLVFGVLKIMFKRQLASLLMFFYMLLFALAALLILNGHEDLLAFSFDSGGVASGPLTSTFILPFAIGICMSINPDRVLYNAFGIVAMVAMTPLITIQLLGFRSIISKRVKEKIAMRRIMIEDDDQIIEFM